MIISDIIKNGLAVAVGAKGIKEAAYSINVARYENAFVKGFKKCIESHGGYDPVSELADFIIYTYMKTMRILTSWDVKVAIAKRYPMLRYRPSLFNAIYKGGILSLIKWREECDVSQDDFKEAVNRMYRSDSKEQDKFWNDLCEDLLVERFNADAEVEFKLKDNLETTVTLSTMQMLHRRFGYEYEEIGAVLKQLEYEENYSYKYHEGKYASEWKKKRKAAEPDLI